MLSTFPAAFPSDATLGSPFSTFDGGFTPWDQSSEPFSIFQFSNPNSELNGSTGLADIFFQPVKPVNSSSSGSIDKKPYIDHQTDSNCSKEPNRTDSVLDERRQRRMISNRESARRSRMRKQKQFESLRNQVNRLRNKKVEISNRLRFTLLHCHRVRIGNNHLQLEHRVLRRRLLDLRQNLYFLTTLKNYGSNSNPIIT